MRQQPPGICTRQVLEMDLYKSKDTANRGLEHIPSDHPIDLKNRENISLGPCYMLSAKELDFLREWFNQMLETVKIRRSKSPAAAPILVVLTPHGRGLRVCFEYCSFNKITFATRCLLPILSEF
jgi:hypothetical protein